MHSGIWHLGSHMISEYLSPSSVDIGVLSTKSVSGISGDVATPSVLHLAIVSISSDSLWIYLMQVAKKSSRVIRPIANT